MPSIAHTNTILSKAFRVESIPRFSVDHHPHPVLQCHGFHKVKGSSAQWQHDTRYQHLVILNKIICECFNSYTFGISWVPVKEVILAKVWYLNSPCIKNSEETRILMQHRTSGIDSTPLHLEFTVSSQLFPTRRKILQWDY